MQVIDNSDSVVSWFANSRLSDYRSSSPIPSKASLSVTLLSLASYLIVEVILVEELGLAPIVLDEVMLSWLEQEDSASRDFRDSFRSWWEEASEDSHGLLLFELLDEEPFE